MILSRATLLAFIVLNGYLTIQAQTTERLKVLKLYQIVSGMGGTDYISVDPGKRIYVTHGSQVNILNEWSGDSLGVIRNTEGVHGIAIVQEVGKGYTSNGNSSSVSVFDLKTNTLFKKIPVGKDPDFILYDGFSKLVMTFNHNQDISLIDPFKDELIGTIPIGDQVEAGAADGQGKLFVNLPYKNAIAVIDIKARSIINYWSTRPAVFPVSLSIDLKSKRLFCACKEQLLIINEINGNIIDSVRIGRNCDGVGFDPGKNLIYASCLDSSLYVIGSIASKYAVFEKIKTARSAKTIAIDPIHHLAFLPTMKFSDSIIDNKGPKMLPGLKILVIGDPADSNLKN